uniref:PH domain-containing protein n=1 Tax=Romanomermis culicivorax TaxID=13658 RepID=A0A915INZ0_ROMCU
MQTIVNLKNKQFLCTESSRFIPIGGPQGIQRYFMVMPDLISKQRWLAAFQKAIPTSSAGGDAGSEVSA